MTPTGEDAADAATVGTVAPAKLAGQAAAAVAEVEAALSVPPDPEAAAFFDIDNTIVQGASIFYLAMGLAKRKFFTRRDVIGFVRNQVKFRMSGAEDMGQMADATEMALGFVEGHAVAEVVAIGRGDLRRDDRRQGLARHPRARAARTSTPVSGSGWSSAAPVELATIIAQRLGLTGALGTVAEIEDGVYTGRLVGDLLHGPAKAEAVTALAEREGLDLSRCAAYTDSANDMPMLSLVGRPVRGQPGRHAARHARDRAGRSGTSAPAARPPRSAYRSRRARAWPRGVAAVAVALERRRRGR